MRVGVFPLVPVLCLVSPLGILACGQKPPPLTPIEGQVKQDNTTPLDPEVERAMWRVKGTDIIDGQGEPIIMRGIAFGNEVWSHTPIPSAHHTGDDYAVVESMGMNVVRFYLSYRTFEEDGAPFDYLDSGWAWIDQNVEWAKQHGIRLILNMHDPVGGYQSQGEGKDLWNDEHKQQRFIELWRAIAERYRAEPTIAGFDLLNEPVPVKSLDQWKDLAEKTIKEIRRVNQHHIIFVERTNAVGDDWSENEDRNFFLVSDPNVVYEFHFYKPFHFTHQGAEWVSFTAREAWYPEENTPEVDWFQLTPLATVESEPLKAGSSDWTLLETKPYVVDDPRIVVGKPFLVCDDGLGTATFDALSLMRLDAAPTASPGKKGAPSDADGPQVQAELDLDTTRGWYFWQQNAEAPGQARFTLDGHGDKTALAISRTQGGANLGSDVLRFFAKQGSEYTFNALAKGQGLGEKSRCLIRLEFYGSKVPVLPRGKKYLEQELLTYLKWGKDHEVPLFLGEFGTIRESFLPGRGGLDWVSDMLDLLEENDVHFTYHAYHEMPFGLFLGGDTLPSQYGLYQPLYDLFVEKLDGSGQPPWGASTPEKGNEQAPESEDSGDTEAAPGAGAGQAPSKESGKKVVIETWD